MNKSKLEKVIAAAKDELFRRVGFKGYCQRFVDNDERWYQKKEWSREQEAEFVDWLTKTIEKEMKLPEPRAREEALWFNLSYGWKTLDGGAKVV